MINHVVLFKLKEFENEDLKALVRSKITHALLGLKDKIPEIKYMQVGENHDLNTQANDICLISHFETLADLASYQVHPEHLKVIDLVRENTTGKAAVDFEF
ncbi:MAG: Dabb family protein [Mariniphaga sp.]